MTSIPLAEHLDGVAELEQEVLHAAPPLLPHVAEPEPVANQNATEPLLPHVAELGPVANQNATEPLMPHVAEPEPVAIQNVVYHDFATGRTSAPTTTKPSFATRGKTGRPLNPCGFTWDRVKPSKNTWAYRWRRSGKDPATSARWSPICVRYLSDRAAAVLERKDKEMLKRLVGEWYETKQSGQNSGASDGAWASSLRSL